VGQKTPETRRVPRLAETLFSEIDLLKMSREIEPQMLRANRFVAFSSFSRLFLEILDSRVVDYEGLTGKLNSVFSLYLVCPLY
jgi:hypothetical protein